MCQGWDREDRTVLFDSRHLSGAVMGFSGPGERGGAAGIEAKKVQATSLVLSPGLNIINKSWWVVVLPSWLL